MSGSFRKMMEQVKSGKTPRRVIEQSVAGPDRSDDINTPEAKATAFDKIANQLAVANPNVDKNWITSIGTQLRSGADAKELSDLAYRNRDSMAGKAKIPGGAEGDFDTWDVIYRALNQSFTDQVPAA